MNRTSLTAPSRAGADNYGSSEVSWKSSSSFPLDDEEGAEDLWHALLGDMSFSTLFESKGSSERALSTTSSSSVFAAPPTMTMAAANTPSSCNECTNSRPPPESTTEDCQEHNHGDPPSRHEHPDKEDDYDNNSTTSDDDDDDEQEDILSIRETIEFIAEKQTLLTKVFRMIHSDEARYDASVALQCVQEQRKRQQQSRFNMTTTTTTTTTPDHRHSCIWMDAKRILKEICEKSGFVDIESADRSNTTTAGTTSSSSNNNNNNNSNNNDNNHQKPNHPSPSDPAIDKSTVMQVSSRQYGQLTDTMEATPSSIQTLALTKDDDDDDDDDSVGSSPPLFLLNDGQSWIAQALAQSGSAHKRTSHSNDPFWEVSHSSSTTSANSTSPVPLAAVDLQEALSFTTEARFLTDSSPPYAIVHANGAFLRLAELDEGNRLLPGSLIGKPVESILDLSFSEQSSTRARSGFLQGLLVFPGKRKHAATSTSVVCNLRAIPVLDQTAKRRKVSPSSQEPLSLHASMSHVLFQVQSRDQSSLQHPPTFPNEYTSNRGMVRDVKLAVHTQVGTVG